MKRCFLLFLSVFLCLGVSAQRFDYGVMAGLRLSQPKDYKTHVGFDLGLTGEYKFTDTTDGWYLGASLIFTSRGWKDVIYGDEMEEYSWKCDAYYLELPVMAGYKVGVGEKTRLSLSAGPYVAAGLFGKSRLDEDVPDVVFGNIYSAGVYRRADYGAKIYAGVEYDKWQIGLSFSNSFRNPATGGWRILKMKDRSLSLQIAYMISR